MTPDQHAAPPLATNIGPPQMTPRLQLKTTVPTTGHVDGGWWPPSRKLSIEIPALFAALSDRLGPIALVAYDLDDWDETPRVLDLEGGGVRLEGVSPSPRNPHTLVVIGTDGRRITLLVVAPDADAATAHEALITASLPGNHNTGDTTNSEANDSASRALADVTTRLARHESPSNKHNTATITAWVQEAAQRFAHAPVQTYVPILVEHIVRQRLASTSATP